MKIKNKKLLKLIFAALFAAVLAVTSQIAIPTPLLVPITLQTFIIALGGYLFGTTTTLSGVMVYITLGVIGLPVFSGFRGGAQVLFSATGGFIIGFLILAATCGLSIKLKRDILKIALSLLGLLLCHLCGTAVFSIVTNTPFFEAFMVSSLLFLIKDIILVILAVFISKKIKQRFCPVF